MPQKLPLMQNMGFLIEADFGLANGTMIGGNNG